MHNSYFGKRFFDIIVSLLVLTIFSPLLIGSMIAVWLQDRHSPLYKAQRVSRGNGDFTMIKIRSMLVNADKSGVNSTGNNDVRVTGVGHFIRRYKIDELSQFFNVLVGDMSVIGPRPNTRNWGVDLYTDEEKKLLSVRPGITDLSSIVFSDEGEIIKDYPNADKAYNALIRPWKSTLGLFYIRHMGLMMDIKITFLTALAVLNKPKALAGVSKILQKYDATLELITVCQRQSPLKPAIPPGGVSCES